MEKEKLQKLYKILDSNNTNVDKKTIEEGIDLQVELLNERLTRIDLVFSDYDFTSGTKKLEIDRDDPVVSDVFEATNDIEELQGLIKKLHSFDNTKGEKK